MRTLWIQSLNNSYIRCTVLVIFIILYFIFPSTYLPSTQYLLLESESRLVVFDSLQPHGLYSPWNSPGQNTGVGSLSLLQGIFPTQGLNPGLPHCRRIFYQLSRKGSTYLSYYWKFVPFDHLHLIPAATPSFHPLPLATTYLISFSMSLFLRFN